MQQFKFQASNQDLSCLQHYSSEELSLLNSRRRHNGEISERQSEIQRQNQEEIKEFKRQIQERFKLSICNKIYTFPRIIKSFYDIVSSEEQDATAQSQKFNAKVFFGDQGQFKKKDRAQPHFSKPKATNNNYIKLQENQSKVCESAKLRKDKLKTTESTGKRKEEDVKQKSSKLKSEKTTSGKKEKIKNQRMKTEQQSSGSFLQTLRSKCRNKN